MRRDNDAHGDTTAAGAGDTKDADYKPEHWTKVTAVANYKNKPAIRVTVNDRAATRKAIVDRVRKSGTEFVERSSWGAIKHTPDKGDKDWDYHSIALHHAGNSFSCSARSVEQMRKIETIEVTLFNQLSYHYAVDCLGTVYEAQDIRLKGAHIKNGNTGVIGIVFLADFSVRGEAERYGPGIWNVISESGFKAGIREWLGVKKDKLAVTHDDPTEPQLVAAEILIKSLLKFFKITALGGHREFAQAHGSNRACPGVYGMIVASEMRKVFSLAPP